MIKNAEVWERWKAGQIAREPADFARNLQQMEFMYEHARRMGALDRPGDPERLKFKIHFARALNGLRTP